MLVACGTAYYSCMIAKYWLEQFAEIPTSIDIGSEYRYRKDRLHNKAVGVVVSQSGETMDTLECLKKFKQNNIFSVAIVNVLNSSIARFSDYILPTLAGPEFGVASTKAFTAQLTVLALLSIHIAKQKKQKLELEEKNIFDSLFNLHDMLLELLKNSQPYVLILIRLKIREKLLKKILIEMNLQLFSSLDLFQFTFLYLLRIGLVSLQIALHFL